MQNKQFSNSNTKSFNNSLRNIATPSSPAIASNSSKPQFGLMSNPPPPSSGSFSSASIGSLASASAAAANASTNATGSMFLANNNHETSSMTVAAVVAAAAAAAAASKMNGSATQHQHRPSAATTLVSSSALMSCHPNGLGGGSTLLLGGNGAPNSSQQHHHHHRQQLLNQAVVYQSQQPLSQLSAAKALAAAVAAAAATVAQQQQHHYRQQIHPASTPVSVAAPPQAALTSKGTNYNRNKMTPLGGEDGQEGGPSQKQSSAMSNTPKRISSVSAPFGGCGEEEVRACTDTVRTLAATVGATSMVATLASPVPSIMLLTTSSSSSHSSNSAGTVNHHAHRYTTGGLSPSSSSQSATGVEKPIISNGGSRNVRLSCTSDSVSSIAATVEQPNGQLVLGAPKGEALSVPEVETQLYIEDTTVVMDTASKNSVDETGSSSSTSNVHHMRNAPKHKLGNGGTAFEPPATKMRLAAKVSETTNDSRVKDLTELDVQELMSVAKDDGGERLHNGPSSRTVKDDAAVTRMLFAANNGVAGGHSPPATTPLERCKKILL